MRMILLLLALAQTAAAQREWAGHWVGPISADFDTIERRGAVPTDVTIEREGEMIHGTWRTLKPNNLSGTFNGTIQKDGTAKLAIVFYADASLPTGGVQPERCKADGAFIARITPADMISMKADRLKADSKRDCGWPRNLEWLLQRH